MMPMLHRRTRGLALLAVVATVLLGAGCDTSPPRPAPVIERGSAARMPPRKPTGADTRPEFYTVKRGDTLHSIALDQGVDYRDLAVWNGLTDPNRIAVGQELRVRPPASPPADGAPATVAPLATVPPAEGRPLGGETATVPVSPRTLEVAPPAALVRGPKAQRLPYSEAAVNELKMAPSPFSAAAAIVAGAPPRPGGADTTKQEGVRTETPKTDLAKLDPKAGAAAEGTDDDADRVNWSWPATGKVVTSYSEAANLKGIGIGGKAGQPVLASAAGKVVYAGSGLRGYGKLVIIKHNKTYLSVYAHNSEILVKEGQTVTKGQKIAEMGNTDSDQVKLHFEIRRQGKPVDPLRYLPSGKG